MRRLLFAGLTVVAVALSGFAIENFEITTNDTVVTVTCTGGNLPVLTVPFFKEDVSKVIFDANTYFKYNPTEPSTYEGGTEILRGQLYPLRGDAFGTGPVIVGSTYDGSLMVQNLDLTIPNKIIFPRSNDYAVGFGDEVGSLTVKSLSAEGSQNKTMRFGRTGKGGVGRVTLSLTDPDSDAVSQYIFSGALQLKLDGGTIKARADAKNPFFTLSTADDPDITVTTQGVTFDNPVGSTLVLGQPLKFPREEIVTVLDTYTPVNAGFEEGSTGWTFTQNPTDSGSEVKTTPNAWDNAGANRPDGQKFAMLREGASVSTTVNLPDDGLWRVVFKRGGRKDYSLHIDVTVKVDGEVVSTIPKTDVLDFFECASTSVTLDKGEHTLEIAASAATATHSVNIDSVRLERVSVETVCGTLGKTGAGTLAFDGDDFTLVPIAVNEGTLALKNMTLTDNAVTVAGGATLDLSAVTAAAGTTVSVAKDGLAIARQATFGEESVVTVAAGGKVALSEFSPNIVVNGDFEADGKKTYSSRVQPKGWLFSRDEELKSNGDCGLMGNPDPSLSSSGPLSPNGDCAVYLRESQSFFQTNVVPVAGTYRLSFLAADRRYASSQKVPFYAAVDGVVKLAQGERTAASDFVRYTVDVELAAGAHEIRLGTGKVNDAQGNMVFFDDVSFRRVNPFAETAFAGEVRMASGSTLDLDLVGELTIKDFFVDGVKVNGRRSAIERAGVTVTGNGSIRVGEKLGMMLIFR